MKKSFIAALLFGSLLSAKGWGMEEAVDSSLLWDVVQSNPLGARQVLNSFGIGLTGDVDERAIFSLSPEQQLSLLSLLLGGSATSEPVSASASAGATGAGAAAGSDSCTDHSSGSLIESYKSQILDLAFRAGNPQMILAKAAEVLEMTPDDMALNGEISLESLLVMLGCLNSSLQGKFLKNIGIDASAASEVDEGLEASLALARQLAAEEQKARSEAFYASAYGAASAERLVGEAPRTAPTMIVAAEAIESLDQAVRVHGTTSQDTDVHAFNARFSVPVIQGINGLATRLITEKGLELPSLATLAGLTENAEARAILMGANINGHDSESGGVSLHAAREVQEAYALAEFVDRWEHDGAHRFADTTGTQVAGNLVGLLFHKLGENVATGGGCTAGIRGRATEVKLICLNILRNKGFFRIG